MEMLTPAARDFVCSLHREFDTRRLELLALRAEREETLSAGELPGFLSATEPVRTGDWQVAAVPAPLQDRRFEITGPVDRKMMINALNSRRGSSWPTSRTRTRRPGTNVIEGQQTATTRSAETISLDRTGSPTG